MRYTFYFLVMLITIILVILILGAALYVPLKYVGIRLDRSNPFLAILIFAALIKIPHTFAKNNKDVDIYEFLINLKDSFVKCLKYLATMLVPKTLLAKLFIFVSGIWAVVVTKIYLNAISTSFHERSGINNIFQKVLFLHDNFDLAANRHSGFFCYEYLNILIQPIAFLLLLFWSVHFLFFKKRREI